MNSRAGVCRHVVEVDSQLDSKGRVQFHADALVEALGSFLAPASNGAQRADLN